MTAIVAIRHRGRVWMGGDSLVADDTSCQVTTEPKVWRAAPSLIVGATGDAAVCDIAVLVRPPAVQGDAREWAVRHYVPALREAMSDSGADAADIGLLVGVGGVLLEINAWGVLVPDGYDAIGSGALASLGALSVLSTRMAPKRRIVAALEAAERHTTMVRRPWTILHT